MNTTEMRVTVIHHGTTKGDHEGDVEGKLHLRIVPNHVGPGFREFSVLKMNTRKVYPASGLEVSCPAVLEALFCFGKNTAFSVYSNCPVTLFALDSLSKTEAYTRGGVSRMQIFRGIPEVALPDNDRIDKLCEVYSNYVAASVRTTVGLSYILTDGRVFCTGRLLDAYVPPSKLLKHVKSSNKPIAIRATEYGLTLVFRDWDKGVDLSSLAIVDSLTEDRRCGGNVVGKNLQLVWTKDLTRVSASSNFQSIKAQKRSEKMFREGTLNVKASDILVEDDVVLMRPPTPEEPIIAPHLRREESITYFIPPPVASDDDDDDDDDVRSVVSLPDD